MFSPRHTRGTGIARGNQFIHSARLIAGLTICSRVLGLVRDAVCARFFGAQVLHYFYVPFLIPNLFRRLFGEGALTSALIPVYTEQLHRDRKAAALLGRTVVTLLVIVLAAATLLGLGVIYLYWHFVSSQGPKTLLTLRLAAIMLPYMILICAVAAVGGLLNVHRRFAAPAAAPIVLNCCMIAAVLWGRRLFGDDPWRQIYAIAWAVLIAGFLQLLLQYPALRRAGISVLPRLGFSDQGLSSIVRLMAPMVLGLAAVQINTMLDQLIAMFLSATPETGDTFILAGRTIGYPVEEGSVTYLYYAQRCYQLPLGVFGIALATAIFPVLSSQAVKEDYQGFSRTLGQGLCMVVFIALPCTVALILIRLPMVQAIFQGGEFTATHSARTAGTLLFYALGILPYFLQQLLVRAYYAFQDSVTPVKIAVRMIGLNLLLNLILIWPLATGGLALSTAICATIQVVFLWRLLARRHQLRIGGDVASTLTKTAIATILMAVACLLCLGATSRSSALVQLIAAVPISAAVFVGASLLLKNEQIRMLFSRK